MPRNSPTSHRPEADPIDFRRITRVILLSAALSAAISGIEYILYLYTGSLALKADAFHTGSDVLAILLVLANSTVLKNRDRRLERLSGLCISVLIFVAAGNVIIESWRVKTGEPKSLWPAMIAVITALVLTYTLSRYKIKVGREEGFKLLVSEGRHSYMDALSSTVVLAGLIGQEIGIRLDTPAAIIVAALVGATGWTVLREHAFDGLRTFKSWDRSGFLPRIRAAAAIVLAVYLFSGFYTVGEGQAALVQRWGRLVRTTGPGLHYQAPWPFEKITLHDCSLVQRLDIGSSSKRPLPEKIRPVDENSTMDGNRTPLSSEAGSSSISKATDPTDRFIYGDASETESNPVEMRTIVDKSSETNRDFREAIRFTGDQNLIEIHMSVYYQISNPAAFQFNLENGLVLLKALCESAAMTTLSRHSLNAVIGGEKAELLAEMKKSINREAVSMDLGVEILWLSFLELKPPEEVMPAFRMVSSAQEDRERYINEAHTRARMASRQGQARMLNLLGEARAYAVNELVKAEAESHRLFYLSKHMEYHLEEYINILYLETMEEVLKGKPKLFLPPEETPLYIDLRRDKNMEGRP